MQRKKREQLHEAVYNALLEHEALKVTELAKIISVPVATVHRFLVDQDFFFKTEDREWVLPSSDAKAWTESKDRLAVAKEWPLHGAETEPPKEVLQFIEDPAKHAGKLLKMLKEYEDVHRVISGRINFLRNLGLNAFSKNWNIKIAENRVQSERERVIGRIVQYRLDNHEISRGQIASEKKDLQVLSDEELAIEIGRYL